MVIGHQVGQEVSPPFCVFPIPSRRSEGSVWPLFVVLAIGGTALVSGGIWRLIVRWPDSSLVIVMIVLGGLLLWLAAKLFRMIDSDDGWWLGFDHDRFYMRMGPSLASWPWMDVGSFRVAESVIKDGANANRMATVALSAEAREGPPIDVPFEIFVPETGREQDSAESFCRFLNEVRQRAKSGGLERGASPLVVPIELTIIPMSDGAPAFSSGWKKRIAKSVVQRRR